MKKVLVTLVLVMTLGVSVSFAQAAPVEVPVVEKPQQSKKLVFSEIYMNDVPEAVMGISENTHDLSIAIQKAETALQYTVAVRDKLLTAYNEIMQMQI